MMVLYPAFCLDAIFVVSPATGVSALAMGGMSALEASQADDSPRRDAKPHSAPPRKHGSAGKHDPKHGASAGKHDPKHGSPHHGDKRSEHKKPYDEKKPPKKPENHDFHAD